MKPDSHTHPEFDVGYRAGMGDSDRIVSTLVKERDDLHDALAFAARCFLHRGPNGQRCHCDDCSKVRRALSKPRSREFSAAEARRAEEILHRRRDRERQRQRHV